MFCPKCGQTIPDGSKFCQSCGAKLVEATIDSYAGVDPAIADIVDGTDACDDSADTQVTDGAGDEGAVAQAVDGVGDVSADGTGDAEANSQADSTGDESEGNEDSYDPVKEVEDNVNLSGAEQMAEQTMGYVGTASESAAGIGAMGAGDQAAYQGGINNAATVGATVAKKGLSKPVLFGIIGGSVFFVAAAITLLIVILATSKKTVYNLQDYTEVTFEGINGNGTAELDFKTSELSIEIAKNMGIDVDKLKNSDISDFGDLGGDLGDIFSIYTAVSALDAKLDKTKGLSNGDTVTVTYTFDNEKAKDIKAEFKGEPMTFTVSELGEVKEIDPFENLEVTFEGTSPNIYLSYRNSSSEKALSLVYFSVDKNDRLKLGDTVTIKVEGYNEENFAAQYGVKFSSTSKEFKVENVDAYITENTELEDAALDIMKTSTENYVTEYFADSYRRSSIKASDVTYEGYYLLTNKSNDVWSGYNKVYVVYSATVSSKEKPKAFKPTKVYFPVQYDDIKKLKDGSYEINASYKSILGSTSLTFSSWQTVSGYQDMADMHEELIDADVANYDGVAYGNVK